MEEISAAMMTFASRTTRKTSAPGSSRVLSLYGQRDRVVFRQGRSRSTGAPRDPVPDPPKGILDDFAVALSGSRGAILTERRTSSSTVSVVRTFAIAAS